MEVVIYSKDNCPNCIKALYLLEKYAPVVLKVGQDLSRDAFLKKFPDAKTMPQVVINNEHIGGYYDIEKWISFQELTTDF